ncbi:MAG: TonB-dependent receptor domain-containing protein [Butyricimonas faecihominis]
MNKKLLRECLHDEPFIYRLEDYNFETGVHKLQNERGGTYLIENSGEYKYQTTQVSYEIRALHTAAWKEHQTSLTGVFSAQETTTSATATVLDGIPQRNMSLSMRGSYGFKDKYFVEASFGYNGSERFARNHQWGFFPAVGGAWIASKENFLADNTAHWLSFLKFRVSWGKVGNDGIIASPRFTHLPLITTANTTDPRPSKTTMNRYVVQSYPNTKIKWEIAEQANLGVELKLFDGIFEATADFYQEVRHNILDYRKTVPESTGLAAYQLSNGERLADEELIFLGKSSMLLVRISG